MHETANRGQNATRSRPPFPPCQAFARRSVSARAARVSRKRPAGFVAGIVHQSVSARDAHARRGRRAEDRVRVVRRRHVEDGRRPAREELGEAEARRDLERRVVVRGLARPDVRREPREELQVVGAVAQERLAEMDVRLDEAGQEPTSPSRSAARRAAPRPRRSGPRAWASASRAAMAPSSTRRAPPGDDVGGARHPDHEGVLDEEGRHGSPPLSNAGPFRPAKLLRGRAASACGGGRRRSR